MRDLSERSLYELFSKAYFTKSKKFPKTWHAICYLKLAQDVQPLLGGRASRKEVRQENPGMARILVFDADAPIRNLLREVLELEGYDVVEADNTYEGIQQPQAVAAELVMPEI